MHPGFFEAIGRLVGNEFVVSVWGAADDAVLARAQAMRHPECIRFCGETADPAAALSEANIFFYPLQPDHYGTAENALIEAMSLGLTPVVWGNPAERAIIRDGETGFVAHSIAECISLLQMLLLLPELRDRISRNAVRHVAENLTPTQSALEFMILWLGLVGEPEKHCDFRGVVGDIRPIGSWRPNACQAPLGCRRYGRLTSRRPKYAGAFRAYVCRRRLAATATAHGARRRR